MYKKLLKDNSFRISCITENDTKFLIKRLNGGKLNLKVFHEEYSQWRKAYMRGDSF